jgi:hypothetical protein
MRLLRFFCCLMVLLSVCLWGSKFVARFPAKMDLAVNLELSADVFPRQSGFGGFYDCCLD